jgi:hypothetical protein
LRKLLVFTFLTKGLKKNRPVRQFSATQGGGDTLRMEEEIQGIDNTWNDDIRRKKCRRCRTLPPKHGDSQTCLLEHESVVAAIADADRRHAPQLMQIFGFAFLFTARRQDMDCKVRAGKGLVDAAEGIGGENVDLKMFGEESEQVGDTAEQLSVKGQGTVVIKDKMGKTQMAEIGDVDLDHNSPPALKKAAVLQFENGVGDSGNLVKIVGYQQKNADKAINNSGMRYFPSIPKC